MCRLTVAVLVVAVAGAVAAAAVSASPLRVLASSSSRGDIAVTAASGSKEDATVLYMRGYGRGLSGRASVACSRGIADVGAKSTTLAHMISGRLYRLRLPFPGDCQVTGGINGRGPIRLQLLG